MPRDSSAGPGPAVFILIQIVKLAIQLSIGKESDNTEFRVDLTELPHLFVSYSEREQRDGFYVELIRQCRPKIESGEISWAFAGSADPILESILKDPIALVIRHSDGSLGPITRISFLKILRTELQKRVKHGAKREVRPVVIFIDDLFETVIQKRKTAGRYFLELLKYGPDHKMYMIMASIRTYRNLVYQLIDLVYDPTIPPNPEERVALQQRSAELVITPEDLYFYRTAREPVYIRLFAWNEGEKET